MDPWSRSAHVIRQTLPRVSGDGPDDAFSLTNLSLVAPRERGWTLAEQMGKIAGLRCPA